MSSDDDDLTWIMVSGRASSDRLSALGHHAAPRYAQGRYEASLPDHEFDGVTLGGWIARLLLVGIAVAIIAGFVASIAIGVTAFFIIKATFFGARRRRRR